jgi:superfamily II DNA/RNA helicase/cold shock CspA family protein
MDRADRNQNTAGVIDRCGSTIVFTRTRHGADRLAKQLSKLGVSAQPIHGGRSQNQRDRALDAFKQGNADALIATDVAARGIHVNGVSAVIHYDPPADGATYHHRSGRTARAGATGIVVSFVEPGSTKDVKKLQRDVGIQVDVTDPDLDDLEATILLDGPSEPVVDAPVRRAPVDKALAASAPAPHRETTGPVPVGHELGTVKFFNASRGYGFIVRDTGGEELFVHFSNIETDGFKTLDEKARVSYEVGAGKKGDEARTVRVR